MTFSVLVVDDEADIRSLISDVLRANSFMVQTAVDGVAAIESLHQHPPTIVLLDIWLQGSEVDGLGVLELIREKYPHIPVIMMSGHGTIETAVTAIKMGAFDYLVKPFTEERLVRVVELAKNYYALQRENAELRRKIRPRTPLIGNSAHTNALKAAIERLAPTSSRVLITGASGTGKELVAEEIHYKSKRKNDAFVVFSPVNVTPDRAIIELFGQSGNSRGEQRVVGALERAHMGTLYIDEIANMSNEMQHMLLRFLQDQTIAKPGQNRLTKLDVRVLSSTSQDTEKAIREGKLLRDLYYRLNVMPLHVHPLAERREDIPALCTYYLKNIAENNGLSPRTIADDAMMVLQAYQWPGNVRQLRNVMEWLLIMTPAHPQGKITADMLPPEIGSGSVKIMQQDTKVDLMSMSLREAREVFERQYLLAQMQRFSNNISKTSSFVGMERSALHRKLKSLNIHTDHHGVEEREEPVLEEMNS